MKGKHLRLLVFFFVLPLYVSAQDYTGYTWYFGNRVVEFNRTNKQPNASTGAVTLGGPGAVAADPATGDVLFYTDGQTVYDASHATMVNGTGLQGDVNGNQPVVLGQVPGQPNQYYVITNSATGEIRTTIVDMSLQGNPGAIPLGEVDNATKNTLVPGLVNQSQAMLTIPHENGTDFWLITHTTGSSTYNVTLFTSAGPVSTTSFSGVGLIENAANFTYNPATGQIAVSPREANRNVEILNFSAADGSLSFENDLPLSAVSSVTTDGVYDVEWSPNGQYLYLSHSGDDGQPDLLQYDLANLTSNNIVSPVSVLPQPNTVTASYGLQTGPDGAIYHLYESGGQIHMGKINAPDSAAALVNYEQDAIAGPFGATQFPSFVPAQTPSITIDFEATGCVNVPTQLFPTVTPSADSLQWFIDGDPVPFSNSWSPVHTFDQAGPVSVTVIAWIGGEPTSYTEQIVIQDFDTQITLEPEVTGCHSEFKEPRVKPPGWVECDTPGGDACLTVEAQIQGTQGTIRWFGPDGEIAGANTTTLSPPSPGYYYIVVGDGPCFAYAGVNVKEYDVPDPRSNVWYFGNGAGLDFNPLFSDPPGELTDISNGVMNAPQGTATMSDRNGQAILYTDGETVWNKNNEVIATDIGGSQNATQSSLIMAVPGDETLYYIFTTQEMTDGTYELRYTLFDLKLNGGTGGIVDPDNDPGTTPPSTVLFTRSTERLLAVGDLLIAHEYGNNTFRAYRITPQGISAPIISNIGSDHTVAATTSGEGYMAYAAGRIAVGLTGPGGNTVEVFDLDTATGEITNFRSISVAGAGQVYGVAFSSSGEKLYVTMLGNPGEILEFYYDEDLDTYVQMPAPIPMTGLESVQPGAMQFGPDGQLYVALDGQNFLGAIQPQDDDDTPSTFMANATPNLGGTSTLGLPNFVQQIANPIQGPGVTVPQVCINNDALFVAVGKDATIDEFEWIFSDGITPSDPTSDSVSINVATPGQYTVRVKIWNKCEGSQQAPYFDETITFDIHDIPLPPPMLNGEVGIICDADGIDLIGSDPADPNFAELTYQWNTGSDQRIINVTTPGQYSVTVTNQFGCENQGQAVIAPYLGNVSLGPDLNVCQDSELQLNFAVTITDVTYTWYENGVVQPTPSVPNTFDVNTATPGTKTYRVEVVDNVQSCTVSDEVIVEVNPVPVFTATPQDDTNCDPGINDGEILLNITQPAGRPLTYSIVGDGGFSQSATNVNAVFNQNFVGLGADVYNITVADQVSNCAANEVVTISNSDLAFTATESGTCHPDMAIDVAITLGSGPYTYQIFDSGGGLVRDGNGDNPGFTTVAVPDVDDTYTIRLTNGAGCQASQSVDIQQDAPYDVFIGDDLLCNLSQVGVEFASGPTDANQFDWTATTTGGTGNGIVTTGGTTATLAVGTWVVNVEVAGPGACPATATRTVTVSGPITADFTQTDACVDPVVLNATPGGSNFIYRWTRNGSPPIAFTPSLTLTPADDNSSYMVTVINTLNGCSDDSQERVVRVIEPFTVSITLPPFACEGSEFQIVASSSRPDVVTYQWFLNGGALPQSTPVLTANQPGTYRVIGVLLNCTSPPAEGTITPNPAPDVNLGPLRRICPYPGPEPTRTVVIDAGDGFSNYEWFRVEGNAVIPLGVTTQELTADAGGVYRVEVSDDDGCPNTADVEVLEDCDPIISAPNAFRPGSSVAENDGFRVITQFITDEDFEIFIFNRWGEMVYTSKQRDFRWNGGYNGNAGQILPAGTYAYLVRYRSEYHPEEGVKEKRGGVVLLK